MKWLSDMNKRKFNSWSFGNPMSIRFLPEDDAAAQVIKDAEEAERKKQEEFDKARQRADQEAANAAKARQQAAQATQQIAEMQAENETMKTELDALKTKAQDQGIDLKEEDFEDSDKTLVKAIKALEAKLAAGNTLKDERIAKLEKAKDDLLAERQAEQVKRQRNKVYDDLLSELDEEYGPQLRNVAVKQFDELVAAGKVPNTAVGSTRCLEKCYKDAKKAAEKDLKEHPERGLSLDPGSGGGSPDLNKKKLKPGSLAEVSAQLRSA